MDGAKLPQGLHRSIADESRREASLIVTLERHVMLPILVGGLIRQISDFTFEISITDFNGVLEYVGDRGGTITFNNPTKYLRGYFSSQGKSLKEDLFEDNSNQNNKEEEIDTL